MYLLNFFLCSLFLFLLIQNLEKIIQHVHALGLLPLFLPSLYLIMKITSEFSLTKQERYSIVHLSSNFGHVRIINMAFEFSLSGVLLR